ncbi:MAG: terpene cyclase/mutase family protein [Planctomycetes bacterium]|nr:terpene cyclase/mutase family protein [Planctomycetota bacterium]
MIIVALFSHALLVVPPYQEPTVPLDPRIKGERITSLAPPEATVTRPVVAPIHRITGSATESGLATDLDARARVALRRGLGWLSAAQDPSGGWLVAKAAAGTDQPRPSQAASTAVTGLAMKAFAQAGDATDDATIARALGFIKAQTFPTGTFVPDPAGSLGNYVAASIAMGLAALDRPNELPMLEQTVEWLRQNQWDHTEGLASTKDWYGGAGYGNWGRPDLSNTQLLLDALHDAGVSQDDPAVQRALAFVTRTQNLKSTNPSSWAQSGSDDGGFVYTPANGGESFASEDAGEGRYGEKLPAGTPRTLRSYGSMTYAGLKSLLYAGLSPDDPRVKAARGWIALHWGFESNPGLGTQGLFYYRHAMARALAVNGERTITDAKGTVHDWRVELIESLLAAQRPDGSWVNATARWQEDKPELVTCYTLLALEEALKPSLTPAVVTPARPAP